MYRVNSAGSASVSFDKYGSGPPLVLVHGAFSDHKTNWEFVGRFFEKRFAVYAVARRGRGETDATQGHSLEDEAKDILAVIDHIGGPVFLLGHSYGAQVALAAAAKVPDRVRKLVLYEPPWPGVLAEGMELLEGRAEAGDWNGFTWSFFVNVLSVPVEEVERLRGTGFWPVIVGDAKATLGDLRALSRYQFDAERFSELRMPVLLQIGSESPRDLYVTDALMEVLPDARLGELRGQGHEGMATSPKLYAEAIVSFLLN